MSVINGRIGKEHVEALFERGHVVFKKKGTTFKKTKSLWFVYFQRVNKCLKTCDAVIYDGEEMIEFVVSQKDIDEVCDMLQCVSYVGDSDPLPWKRFLKDAKKHEWDKDDWQHLFEIESDNDDPEEEEDWVPSQHSSSESDEDSDGYSDEDSDEDKPPSAKRRKTEAQDKNSAV